MSSLGRACATAIIVPILVAILFHGCARRSPPNGPQGDTGNAATHVRSYGEGDLQNSLRAFRTTSDGGYIVVGDTRCQCTSGGFAMWVIKANGDGSVAWQQRLGAAVDPGHFVHGIANDVQLTLDGGYVIAGRIDHRATVIKLNADGSIAWQWAYTDDPFDPSGPMQSEAFAVQAKTDGFYLVAGGAGTSNDSGNTLHDGDASLIELNSHGGDESEPDVNGNRRGPAQWRIFNGGQANAILALIDGGYVVAGKSFGGSSTAGIPVKWAARVDGGGLTRWKNSYDRGEFRSIRAVSDGFVLAGDTPSGIFVSEMNGDGEVIWANEYRSADPHSLELRAHAIQPTSDGGYVVAATYFDRLWVLKLDSRGFVRWQNTYLAPGPRLDTFGGAAFAVETRAAGGYRVVGRLDIYREAGSRESGSLAFFDELGWVSDLNDDGSIDINVKSGVTVAPTGVVATDVTSALAVVRYGARAWSPRPSPDPDF